MLEESYMFMGHSMLVEGSQLNIEIHKKHSRQQKIFTNSEEGSIPKANIKFDDLRKHLSSQTNCEGIFTSVSPNFLIGHQ